MDVIKIIIIYLLVMNVLAFALMGIDKWKASSHRWRIPEAHLFIMSIMGGSLGAFLGMYIFRHKTKKWYFRYGFPLILGVHLILAAYLIGSGNVVIM